MSEIRQMECQIDMPDRLSDGTNWRAWWRSLEAKKFNMFWYSTDSALDHSHSATQWTWVKNMQICQNLLPILKIRTDTAQHLASCTAGKRFSGGPKEPKHLSTRFVTMEDKVIHGRCCWFRARYVAREYAWLSPERQDLFSQPPATSRIVCFLHRFCSGRRSAQRSASPLRHWHWRCFPDSAPGSADFGVFRNWDICAWPCFAWPTRWKSALVWKCTFFLLVTTRRQPWQMMPELTERRCPLWAAQSESENISSTMPSPLGGEFHRPFGQILKHKDCLSPPENALHCYPKWSSNGLSRWANSMQTEQNTITCSGNCSVNLSSAERAQVLSTAKHTRAFWPMTRAWSPFYHQSNPKTSIWGLARNLVLWPSV